MNGQVGRRVLLISPEAWGDMRLSKHHYASALADRGDRVYFLNPSLTQESLRIAEVAPRLFSVQAPGALLGQRFLPRSLRAWMDAQQLADLANLCGGPFDILWNFDLYRFRSLRQRTNAKCRLLHVMDLPVTAALSEPAENADLVVAVSADMLSTVHATHTLHIPHAAVPPNVPMSTWHAKAGAVNIGYLGNLGIRYLDLEGILRIADAHPEAMLHLYGPYDGAFGNTQGMSTGMLTRFRSTPNIRLHGPIPSSSIPRALESMDVLLVAYDTARFRRETVNSHKLLEYLHTGRTVVSSWMDDQCQLTELVAMAPPGVSVSEIIGPVLRDLGTWNSAEREEARRRLAASRTYPRHAAMILEALDNCCGQ